MTEARNRFFALVRVAERGEEVIIERYGKPYVRLSPIHLGKFEFGVVKLTPEHRLTPPPPIP